MTKEEFSKVPIGTLFVESCCSGTTFIKAMKVSETEIEKLEISSLDFTAFCEIKEFDPEFDWIETVRNFTNVRGEVSTFEELKDQYLRN